MRQMDEMGLKLCRMQAYLFVESLKLTECSSAVFLRRFMISAVARRMDLGSLAFESSTEQTLIDEINAEFGESSYGKVLYSEDELYWIGYLYRYWCYTYEKSSKQVYEIIKPSELRSLYFPYHSLDTGAAIERILEAKGNREEDLVKKGVLILRRLIMARDYDAVAASETTDGGSVAEEGM